VGIPFLAGFYISNLDGNIHVGCVSADIDGYTYNGTAKQYVSDGCAVYNV